MGPAPLPRQLTELLLCTDEMWRAIAESPFDYVCIVDRRGGYLYMNRTAPGVLADDLLGKLTIFDFLEPPFHAIAQEALRTVFEDGRPTYYEAHVTVNDSWMASVLAPVRREGVVVAASVMSRECTAQKRAEANSREADARYRSIVEGTRDGIWLIDTEARTTFVNARLADMLGYTPEEMLGMSLMHFVSEEWHARAKEQLDERFRGRHQVHDFCFVRRDGTELWVIVSASPTYDADGKITGAMALLTDVSERKRWEREVAQAEKMQVVGRLAGGIAHEFNNLLTSIMGFGGLLEVALVDQPNPLADVGHILSAAERASGLVRQLLTFARRQESRPRVVNVSEVVRSLRAMLESVLPGDVRLTLRFEHDRCLARIDPAQLEQVLLNLVINARDAIVTSGHVLVRVEAAGAPADPCVVLTVSDDGAGIAPFALEHIFEPFFTTKGPEKGTGLGLSIVYTIVQQNGGSVAVKSAPGRGSEFTVRLPAVEGPDADASGSLVGEPVRGSETLLLVEDDALVRASTQRTLQALGYRVIAASGGQDALEAFAAMSSSIAAVVSDVVMPHMNGPQLVERLRVFRPDLRVLFLSGYSGAARETRGLDTTFPVLDKPYTLRTLASALRDVLDAPRTDGPDSAVSSATRS